MNAACSISTLNRRILSDMDGILLFLGNLVV